MKDTGPPLLLINPWIDDFAAYDFFAQPLGLLYLAGLLAESGYEVHLLDCLGGPRSRSGPFGTGRYSKEIQPTPPPLASIPRRYGRYGIPESNCRARLSQVPRPAAILVTSLMTYWYPGVSAAVRLAREHFPGVPVILGGIYATLCPEHARRHSGADLVVSGPGEEQILALLADLTGFRPPLSTPLDFESLPYPALHWQPHLSFIPSLTSWGCPFSCSYCASHLLQPRYQRRQPLAVAEELLYWQEHLGLIDVAFYDDALLLQPEEHLLMILQEVRRRGRPFRFHTPNGLHVREITPEVAQGLKEAPFATLRLGVETTALGHARFDDKLAPGELETALTHLKEAGFKKEEMGVYLLVGLPDQEDGAIETSIRRI